MVKTQTFIENTTNPKANAFGAYSSAFPYRINANKLLINELLPPQPHTIR